MYTGNYDQAKVGGITSFLREQGIGDITITPTSDCYDVECQMYTKSGGDQFFSIYFYDDEEIESPDYWSDQIYGYAQDFDPLAEAMLWVDETGWGVNGAPGNVITLHDDYCAWAEELMRIASEVGQL